MSANAITRSPAAGRHMVDLATMPLRPAHFMIVGVASLGQLIGTAVATIAGIIIPMLNILFRPGLSGVMQGVIGAADLVGICLGSVLFGKLSDRYGYLFFFRFCPLLILAAAAVAALVPDVAVLTVCLFVIGLGIGGEYSLDSDYISELMPDRYRSLMVGVAKAACALGNIVAAALCFWLLTRWHDASHWPSLMWIVAAIAALMLLLRIRFYQSPGWLISKGRVAEAETEVRRFLGDDVTIDVTRDSGSTNPPAPASAQKQKKQGFLSFLAANWRKVVVSGIPWACEGLGVYGIGVFLPILVMALGLERFTPGEPAMLHVTDSVKITLYISCIILPGFVAGLLLIRRGRSVTSIQTWGFLLCAVALGVLMPVYHLHWNKWIAIGAFMAFEFFLNVGPHLVTYVLPPKIYPVAQRGLGVGIAAAIGKIGAVAGVFVIPLLLHAGGAMLVLGVSAAVMALGALVTFMFRSTVP